MIIVTIAIFAYLIPLSLIKASAKDNEDIHNKFIEYLLNKNIEKN